MAPAPPSSCAIWPTLSLLLRGGWSDESICGVVLSASFLGTAHLPCLAGNVPAAIDRPTLGLRSGRLTRDHKSMKIPTLKVLPFALTAGQNAKKNPFYTSLSFQVLAAIAMAIALGYLRPLQAIAMKPLGDAFIRLITMI